MPQTTDMHSPEQTRAGPGGQPHPYKSPCPRVSPTWPGCPHLLLSCLSPRLLVALAVPGLSAPRQTQDSSQIYLSCHNPEAQQVCGGRPSPHHSAPAGQPSLAPSPHRLSDRPSASPAGQSWLCSRAGGSGLHRILYLRTIPGLARRERHRGPAKPRPQEAQLHPAPHPTLEVRLFPFLHKPQASSELPLLTALGGGQKGTFRPPGSSWQLCWTDPAGKALAT